MGELVLTGGRVLCPASSMDERADVRVVSGRISAIGVGVGEAGDREIDCTGHVLSPGFVELVSDLGEPGMTWREDLQSGSQAAAAGGFTTVLASPNTDPVVDNPAMVHELRRRAEAVTGARVEVVGALTMGNAGQELAEVGLMVEGGVVALSDGGQPIENSGILRRVLEYSRNFGVPIILRPTDLGLELGGLMHEGQVSIQIGLRGIPAEAEEIGVARAIALARRSGARVHLSHVTTARAIAAVVEAKAEGLALTATVPARHLVLTDQDVMDTIYDTATKLMPPLRPAADQAAARAALMAGTLDGVCADHRPWSRVEKELEFAHAAHGAMGLETALAATLGGLDGDVPATVRALSTGPAAVLGRCPRIAVGEPGDLAIFSVEESVIAGPWRSKGTNEPLVGRTLPGRIKCTLVAGRVVFGPAA
jgi:dihydroorotase